MNILHTSDLHLGYRQYGIPQREQDVYDALERVVDIAIDKHANVVVAGDTFDSPRPPSRAVLALQKAVDRLREHMLWMAAIEGNHDMTRGCEWLKVCGVIPLDGGVVNLGGIRVCGIPYGRGPAVETRLKELIDQNEYVDLLVTHAGFAEMGGDFGDSESAEEIAALAKHIGVKYVANGHIHMFHRRMFDGVWVVQTGSLELKAANEPHEKQVCVTTWTPHRGDVLVSDPERIVYRTRKVSVLHIASEESLDVECKRAQSYAGNLVLAYIAGDLQDGASRVQEAFEGVDGVMLRVAPDAKSTKADQFDRSGAVATLKDAIGRYFEEGSDEYLLVSEFLQSPDRVAEITEEYVNGK